MQRSWFARATFVEAGPFWRPMLRILRANAITMPWRRIYIVRERIDDKVLRRHEMIHIEQIERDGAVLFCIKYILWSARYGYWKNPYEVEAYRREREPVDDSAVPTKRRAGRT